MGRRCFTRGLKSSLGGRKGAAKRKMISELSGVGPNDYKLNKESSRQRKIKQSSWW